MNRPLFVLGAAVALILGISSAFLQVETVKPPYRTPAADEVSLDRLSARQNRVARAMRNNDMDALDRMSIQPGDMAAVQSRLAAERDLPDVRAAAKEALGRTYAGAFLSGPGIVVTASEPGTVDGASVTVVPHSRRELRTMRNAIQRQIDDRDLGDEAAVKISERRGNLIVSVCALEDTPLDLSSYPSTAVEWRGACSEALDDAADGLHTRQSMTYPNNIIIL